MVYVNARAGEVLFITGLLAHFRSLLLPIGFGGASLYILNQAPEAIQN